MGYTHYWTQKKRFTNPEWKLVNLALGTIITAANLPIEVDLLDPKRIYLNGIDDDAHETFFLSKERQRSPGGRLGWDFCKTNRKPYDVIVTAMLCYLESTFPEHFSVGSDGETADWIPGHTLAAGCFPSLEIYIPQEVTRYDEPVA